MTKEEEEGKKITAAAVLQAAEIYVNFLDAYCNKNGTNEKYYEYINIYR